MTSNPLWYIFNWYNTMIKYCTIIKQISSCKSVDSFTNDLAKYNNLVLSWFTYKEQLQNANKQNSYKIINYFVIIIFEIVIINLLVANGQSIVSVNYYFRKIHIWNTNMIFNSISYIICVYIYLPREQLI